MVHAARRLAARRADYQAAPLLKQALNRAETPEALQAVAEAALDLAEPESFARARDHAMSHGVAGQPGWRAVQARADEIFALTDLIETGPNHPVFAPVRRRLAYVLYSSLPWISTGYAVRSQRLARALGRAGLDVQCLTRPGFPWDEAPAALSRPAPAPDQIRDEIDGVPYLRSSEPVFGHWDNYANYIRKSADVLTARLRDVRPEAVMAASSHACALPALIAARRLGVPMIYDMRGFWELSRASRDPGFLGTPQYRYERFHETAIARSADHVFTLSDPMRRALIGRGVAPDRVTFLPNGCNPARFAPRPRDAALADRLGLETGVPVIGYAGSFPAYEGLEDLLQAAAGLKAAGHVFRLLLVGDENGTGLRDMPVTDGLRHRANELGLQDWLVMPGRLPPDQIPACLSLIDIAAFPRRPLPVTEMVAPLKPVEAMAAGKAIVLSSVGGMTGLVQDGETGLVFEKGQTGDLQRQLARLLEDADLRARLGQAARNRARSQYSWARIAKRMAAQISGPD